MPPTLTTKQRELCVIPLGSLKTSQLRFHHLEEPGMYDCTIKLKEPTTIAAVPIFSLPLYFSFTGLVADSTHNKWDVYHGTEKVPPHTAVILDFEARPNTQSRIEWQRIQTGLRKLVLCAEQYFKEPIWSDGLFTTTSRDGLRMKLHRTEANECLRADTEEVGGSGSDTDTSSETVCLPAIVFLELLKSPRGPSII